MRALQIIAVVVIAGVSPAIAQYRYSHPVTTPATAPVETTYDNTLFFRLPTPPGGVPGNAPFNNQLRKHYSPFSASGAK